MLRRSLYLALPAVGLLAVACSGSTETNGTSPLNGGDAGSLTTTTDGRANPTDASTITREVSEACMTRKPSVTPTPAKTNRSVCTDGTSGTSSVDVSIPATITKGKGLTITWSTAGLPAKSSIGFFFTHKGGKSDNPPGMQGPLMVSTEKVCSSTNGTTEWDGQSVACAPTDAPELCAGNIEPGEYEVIGVVYEGESVALERGLSNEPPPKELARSKPASLTITGDYDLDPLKSRMLGSASQGVGDFVKATSFAGTRLERYVKMRCDSFKTADAPSASAKYCATFDLQAPFEGTFETCGNLHAYEVSRTGTPTYRAGVIDFASAREKARIADKPYLDRVENKDTSGEAPPNGGTYLSSGVTNWAYRDDGGYWVLDLYEIKAGGSESGADRFADSVLVRVGNDGAACIVKTVAYPGSGYNLDIFEDVITCPSK